MPGCGQAVGCGVCDTPELCCGAVGLRARVRACAGAAESLHTYIYTRSSGVNKGKYACTILFIIISILRHQHTRVAQRVHTRTHADNLQDTAHKRRFKRSKATH